MAKQLLDRGALFIGGAAGSQAALAHAARDRRTDVLQLLLDRQAAMRGRRTAKASRHWRHAAEKRHYEYHAARLPLRCRGIAVVAHDRQSWTSLMRDTVKGRASLVELTL
jgi:hypothetical protein